MTLSQTKAEKSLTKFELSPPEAPPLEFRLVGDSKWFLDLLAGGCCCDVIPDSEQTLSSLRRRRLNDRRLDADDTVEHSLCRRSLEAAAFSVGVAFSF